MKFLLRLKAWQLLLMITIAAILGFVPTVGFVFSATWIFLYTGWVYAIGTSMNNVMMADVRPSATYFKYSCLFVFIVYVVMELFDDRLLSLSTFQQPYFYWIQAAISLYTGWSGLYIISFAARMLESVVENEMVGVSGSLKTFIYIMMFPYGIWLIQPAVKNMLDTYDQQATAE